MSGQGEMFEAGYNGLRPIRRNFDPQTSHEAAAELHRSGVLAAQLRATLAALDAWQACGGTPTSHELAGEDAEARYRYARRLADLRDQGFVENGPARVCRVTGRSALVWSVTDAGRAVLREERAA